jgi:paraquat-inducible protein A
VLSGILALFEHNNLLVGCLLLCFSVLFPISKLIVVRLVLQESTRGAVSKRLLHAIAMLSKYSMVDVFVIALLVVASKTAPGSSVELHWGTFAFATAALLSMGLTTAVKRFAAPGGNRASG